MTVHRLAPSSAGFTGEIVAEPHPAQQWVALTGRSLGSILRSGEIFFAVIAPTLFALCFYLPLRSIMNANPGMDYAQYLMPIIALQSMGFAATSAAMRSATDGEDGISTRFRTMPIHSAIPILARTSANTVLLLTVLVCALVASLLIGWRPGNLTDGMWMVLLAVAIGMLLVLLADALGVITPSPEATSQILGLPSMILAMLSTGFIPESQFPEWIQPFVRNQPVSQFANALRALNDGTATRAIILPALAWLVGLGALCVVLFVVGVRKRSRA